METHNRETDTVLTNLHSFSVGTLQELTVRKNQRINASKARIIKFGHGTSIRELYLSCFYWNAGDQWH